MSRWLLRIACLALVLCAVAADYDEQAPSKQRRRRRRTGGAAPAPPPGNAGLAKRVASMERKIKRVASMEKKMKKMRSDIKKLKDLVPEKPKPKPEVKACMGKKEEDACWFAKPGKDKIKLKGHCTGKDPLWCKASKKDPPKPETKPEVKACMGKKGEDACWFAHPGKEKIKQKGHCTGKDPLWCKASKKDPPKPETKPEVKACMGKKEEDACWFANPGREQIKLKGHCTGKDPLWCKASKKAPPKPEPKPEVKACVGKKAKDVCWRPNPKGRNMLKGYCTGKEPLWCKVVMPPVRPEQKPHLKACIGKKDKDACWFPKPGKGKIMLRGHCTGKDPLWCKASKKDPPKPEPKPEVKACVGKKAKDACWLPNPTGKMFKGYCTGKEPLWCKVVLQENPAKPEQKPHLKACMGKKEKDACWFPNPENKVVMKGRCTGKDPLWCKTALKPRAKACVGKKAKDRCWFPDPKNETVKLEGQCIGNSTLWCGSAANFEVKAKACVGKKQKDACWFPKPGKGEIMLKGHCTGKDLLWCKASKKEPPKPAKPEPKLRTKACVGRKAKDRCWFLDPNKVKLEGHCIGKATLWCVANFEAKVKACMGKKQKDACWFPHPDEKKGRLKGSCTGTEPLFCKRSLGGGSGKGI